MKRQVSPQFKRALEAEVRRLMEAETMLVRQWRVLNRKHGQLNRKLNQLYGGPDIEPEEDPTGTVRQRDRVAKEKDRLEDKMTQEEFDMIHPKQPGMYY